jgi:hypothetical protein
LIFGHFWYPFVYEGSPLTDVDAAATTTAAEARAITPTIATSLARMPGSCLELPSPSGADA